MAFPKDPYMLLSVLNMKLRDNYPSFEALCDDTGEDPAPLTETMKSIGYAYSAEENQFVPDK